MKIVGYYALWSIVLALLVSMCAILKEGYVGGHGATDSDVVAGKVAGRATAPTPASKPTSRAALPTV